MAKGYANSQAKQRTARNAPESACTTNSRWRFLNLSLPPSPPAAWARTLLPYLPSECRPRLWVGPGRSYLSTGIATRFTGNLRLVSQQFQSYCRRESVPAALNCTLPALGAFKFTDLTGELVVPSLILARDEEGNTTLIWHDSADPAAHHLREHISAIKAYPPADSDCRQSDPAGDHGDTSTEEAVFEAAGSSVPLPVWEQAVAAATTRIAAGECEKVVLARDVLLRSRNPIPVKEVLMSLLQQSLSSGAQQWVFSLGDLVGATPEVLSEVRDGEFSARVLAGTRPIGRGEELFSDPKELAEHETARESVISALESAQIDQIQVAEVELLKLAHVEHLQSVIKGMVHGANSAQLAAHFHPTAAVCGKPTAAAAQMIAQLEGMERGCFTGPVGYLNPNGDGQWNIALRCAQSADDASVSSKTWRLLAGAGIMEQSDPAREVRETAAKMALMEQSLTQALAQTQAHHP